MRQPRISHEAARGIRKFAFLEMESRAWKSVEITRMVVVQVGQDDILDLVRIDVERAGQRRNVRFRCFATSALNPVSMTKVRPPPFASHMK